MKIDFSQKIVVYNGQTAVDGEGKDVTLKFIALEALMMPPVSENPRAPANLSAVDILARHHLAQRIWLSEDAVEISVEDIALIKRLIPPRFSGAPALAAPALILLDNGA